MTVQAKGASGLQCRGSVRVAAQEKQSPHTRQST